MKPKIVHTYTAKKIVPKIIISHTIAAIIIKTYSTLLVKPPTNFSNLRNNIFKPKLTLIILITTKINKNSISLIIIKIKKLK